MRFDGLLTEAMDRADVPVKRIVSRLKVMAELDIAETRLPQDGRIPLSLGGRIIDTRVSSLPDTSAAGFPLNDWELTANDSAAGGASYLAITDVTNSRVPFQVTANAPTGSLFVDSTGRVGLGTSTPVLNLHAATGNTPAIRLEQNGSSGFTAQTWDVAGNEANFFVRDVTGGSKLSLRIRPGAPTSSIDTASDGDVGMGTAAPTAPLHVVRSDGTSAIVVTENNATAAGRTLLTLSNNGPTFLRLENRAVSATARWVISHDGTGNMGINRDGGANEFFLAPTGNLTLSGTLTTSGSCSVGCDRVFDADCPILPIAERAGLMFENGYLPNIGPTPEDGPFNVTDKMGRMLNELVHAHINIAQLNERLEELKAKLP